jgi:hypothetical protein
MMRASRTFAPWILAALVTGCGAGSTEASTDAGPGASDSAGAAPSGGSTDFPVTPATDILAAGIDDLRALGSVELLGLLKSTGKKTAAVDLQVTHEGECTGSFQIGQEHADVLASDRHIWLKPDPAYWEAEVPDRAARVERVVGNKWVAVPKGSEGPAAYCDLDRLLSLLDGSAPGSPTAPPSSVGTSTIRDQTSTAVRRTSAGTLMTVWVANAAPHHILRISFDAQRSSDVLVFSGFNEGRDGGQALDLRGRGVASGFDRGHPAEAGRRHRSGNCPPVTHE